MMSRRWCRTCSKWILKPTSKPIVFLYLKINNSCSFFTEHFLLLSRNAECPVLDIDTRHVPLFLLPCYTEFILEIFYYFRLIPTTQFSMITSDTLTKSLLRFWNLLVFGIVFHPLISILLYHSFIHPKNFMFLSNLLSNFKTYRLKRSTLYVVIGCMYSCYSQLL